jgi:hypothetical protein
VSSWERIGILLSLEDYLRLAGATGQMIITNKQGAICINLPQNLKGYRLTGNKACNLKIFTPHNLL